MCDTVSSFARHGKKTVWAVWNVLPELTDALLNLSSAPSEIPEEVLHTIERFVILLYDRSSPYTDIDKAHKKLFARKNNVELIPLTKAALEEHVKRAAYQGGHVYGVRCCSLHRSCRRRPAEGGSLVNTDCIIPMDKTTTSSPKLP